MLALQSGIESGLGQPQSAKENKGYYTSKGEMSQQEERVRALLSLHTPWVPGPNAIPYFIKGLLR